MKHIHQSNAIRGRNGRTLSQCSARRRTFRSGRGRQLLAILVVAAIIAVAGTLDHANEVGRRQDFIDGNTRWGQP